MLSIVANELMGKEILKEDSYYKAYKDFRFVRLFIDSKYGVKKAIFNKFLHNTPINTLCQPHILKDNIDYLKRIIREEKLYNILELGSAIGYSAICMASVSDEVRITTIERDEKLYGEAIKNIKNFHEWYRW